VCTEERRSHGILGWAIEVPGLAALNTSRTASVYSVSCAPAGGCVAGGDYFNGRWQAFVVSKT
jgi:hypothetical protein